MAKEGELWDDSALVNAFEQAFSNYKKMNKKKYIASSNEEAEAGNVSALVDEAPEDKGHLDVVGNGIDTSDIRRETEDCSPITESNCIDSHAAELPTHSNGVHAHDELKEYLSGDDYTKLLNQYYEIDEKRQQILQQLQQFGSSYYQYPGGSAASGIQLDATPQEHQVAAEQAPYSTTVSTGCPYGSHCVVAPCMSFPCSLDATSVCTLCTNATTQLNSDIVKTAMGAAGKAISSMKLMNSGEKEGNGKDGEVYEGKMGTVGSTETDLSVVLNAWYTAGFYTGKYLVEQSNAKKSLG